jgi:hypothetical protein
VTESELTVVLKKHLEDLERLRRRNARMAERTAETLADVQRKLKETSDMLNASDKAAAGKASL